ncbi:MAG: L,D-transpeptidase [Bacillota bacterium]
MAATTTPATPTSQAQAGTIPALPGTETVPTKGPYILLNLASTSLYYFEDGRLIKRYEVGVGRTFEQTPIGNFRVVDKHVNPTWYPPGGRKPVPPGPANPLGTRWMGLGGVNVGIHGTNAPWTLGYPSSGGCIRLLNTDAEELYERVKLGTPVKIIYETAEVVHDDATGEDTLIVWADIYRHGQATPEEIIAKLEEAGRPGGARIDDVLEALAASDGKTVRLSLGRPAKLNGWEVPGGVHFADGAFWVKLRPLAESFGHQVVWDAQARQARVDGNPVPGVAGDDGQWRVKLEDLQAILGLPLTWDLDETGRLNLATYGLYLGDKLLTRQVVAVGDDFLIPLRVATADLGLRGWWDFARGQVTAGGDYLPGAIYDYEPYVLLGPATAALGYQLQQDPPSLRLILIKAH